MKPFKNSVLTRRFALLGVAIALCFGALAGCSSGSSSDTSGGGGGGGGGSRVSTVVGRVTDGEGAPVVGAIVKIGALTAQTTQFGNYRLPNVEIPSEQVSQTYVITASGLVNGVKWTGSNVIEVFAGVAISNNMHIVVSDPFVQGEIRGRVTNLSGTPLSGASVYASIALPTDPAHPTDPIVFSTLTAFLGITDSAGNYSIPEIPQSSRYVVVASYPGKLNGQKSDVIVSAGGATPVNFSLSGPGGSSTVPVPNGLYGISLTYPTTATRALGANVNAILRQRVLKQKGWTNRHVAIKGNLANGSITRDAPSGTNIENIVTWDYEPLNNLYGYVVLRSINISTNFKPYAVLQDPLADRFSDADSVITPDITYYYSIARLDTINYPTGGAEGDPVIPPIVVRPLNKITLSTPANNSSISNPVFGWSSVSRATLYQVLVYDRFPTLQSDIDLTNGAQPIWPADPNNPGSSLITDGRTSQSYQGPALIPGHQYYWVVLASDNVGSAFTISPLYTFTAK
ncbi:MAG: carboxypeptidase-like regulatory domain-containing protein [Armatimonadetes bacterium]|nr:carboxypeptidase-like regulatory domain-containing protein [Armatimonadota bacterium]